MALDCKAPQRWPQIKAHYRTTKQLLDAAERDPDAVAVLVDGTSWDDARGAIFVVKDGQHAKQLFAIFKQQGLTSENPIPKPPKRGANG